MKKLFFLPAVVLLMLGSCKDDPKEANPADTRVETNKNPKTTPKEATVEVNPAHGQPGHRCDIPVGAPLDQAKREAATTPSNVSPIRLKSSLPKKNPPHGEPGHDCSVPVGADLPERT